MIGCIVFVASYAVWHGIEVFGRITQIILPFIILVFCIFIILIYGNNLLDLHRIEPILDNGWKKVIDVALPELVSFPFGEMVLFLMFWKFVTPQNKVFRTTVFCYAGSGIFIALFNVIIVAVLGTISQMSVAPFIQMISLVHYASFLERLDPIVMALLYFLLFIKLTAYYLGAALKDSTFRMTRSQTRLTPRKEGGHYVIDIEVKGKGVLLETNCQVDFNTMDIEHEMEKQLEKEVSETIKESWQAVKELKTDEIGFADLIHRKYPREWKQLSPNWQKEFSQIEINPKVDIIIKQSGLTTKSFKTQSEQD